MATLQRLVCAFRGHEEYLHFEKNRVYLECVSCGYQSNGWAFEDRRPALHFQPRRTETRRGWSIKKVA